MKGTRADAALYWKSYALNRLGQRADALATIAELNKGYPNSRYLKEAKALEIEVRGAAGQPVRPEAQADEDLKLMAMQGACQQRPGDGSADPRANAQRHGVSTAQGACALRAGADEHAEGPGDPHERRQGRSRFRSCRAEPSSTSACTADAKAGPRLLKSTRPTTDVDAKRRILRAFMAAGEKDRLLAVAQTEQNPELRAEAVRQLGAMGANEELWQMYQKETST